MKRTEKPHETLRIRMRRNNVTITKLAELIMINRATLSNYMNAYTTMPDLIKKKINDVLLEIEKK